MTNTLTRTIAGLIALGMIAFAMMFLVSGERKVSATSVGATILQMASTTNSYSVAGVSSQVLASSTFSIATTSQVYLRTYATICNPSATVVALNLNGDKPVTATAATVFIAAAAGYDVCYEITDRNLYQGGVQASSTAQATTVFATQYAQ